MPSPVNIKFPQHCGGHWIYGNLLSMKSADPVTSGVFRRGRLPSFLMGCDADTGGEVDVLSSGVTWVFTEALVMLSRWPVPGLLCVNCEWVNTFVKCFSIPTEMSGGAWFCGLGQCPPDSCPQPYPVSALDQWCPVHPRPSFCSWILRSSINQLV